MNTLEGLRPLVDALAAGQVRVEAGHAEVRPLGVLDIQAADWGRAASVAAGLGCRFTGCWGDMVGADIHVFCALVHDRRPLLLHTRVPVAQPVLPSQANAWPAADRLERHLQDLLGVAFLDHPDVRRWSRHQAWRDAEFPLRPDFPLSGHPRGRTPGDTEYPFRPIAGAAVYQIPVGPVHAGIIEPGHFRFHAVGETVLSLEERLGYVHKGIEKLAVGRSPEGLIRLAARVSGDSTVAHAWAACRAMEVAAGTVVPPRGAWLRGLLAERERVANHLGDIGAICNDVGFRFAQVQCSRLRELWLRRNGALFGHRLLMDTLAPGGVARDPGTADIDSLHADHQALRAEIAPLFDIIDDHPSLADRLLDTGRLTPEDAAALGVTGHVGKASGQDFDLRRDCPYAPYDALPPEVPCYQEGDVAARVRVRMDEVLASLDLMDRLLEGLPPGPVSAPFQPPAGASGIGQVEGWRGDILCYVRFDDAGRVARFFPRDPSWFHWPALERLIDGNIVPDFPVCNKSVNASYSGHDL